MKAKNVLRNMFYIEKDSHKIIRSVPTLVNWLFTIDGFHKLWQIVHEKYDFNKLNTHHINQDKKIFLVKLEVILLVILIQYLDSSRNHFLLYLLVI